VVEQNEFDQNVSDKKLIHDFDQTVEWKMNNKVLAKPQFSGPNFIVEDHQQMRKATVEDFGMAINELRSKRPNVYEKLIKVGVKRWSRAYCPRDRDNYMTSNSAESINSLTRDVRKIPITNLMKWYRKLMRGWYCKRREKYKDGPLDELSGWAKVKIRKRMQKSLNWVDVGIAVGRNYEVDDGRRIQTVELCNDCHRLAKGWFMRIALKGTYQELVYPVGEVSCWQIPNYLPVVKPP
nr:hypothetical protein [Tanacetum cinerariifolium]